MPEAAHCTDNPALVVNPCDGGFMKLIKPTLSAVALALIVSAGSAQSVSVKLTSNALGLGTNDLNAGSTVSADIAGKFITSSTTGQGSVLYIQANGKAGMGDASNPLLATVTANSYLDYISGVPSLSDVYAGIIYMSKENSTNPDGVNEGLGVRAYTVNNQGLRTFYKGLAKIEGSKEVSGGTGPTIWDPKDPNGAPHVDEQLNFAFNQGVFAKNLTFTVTSLEKTDKIDLTVTTLGGMTYNKLINPVSDSAFFTQLGTSSQKTYVLNTAAFGLGDELLSNAVLRAVDPNPLAPKSTAEHFLVSGFSAQPVPEPGILVLAGLGGLAALKRRRAKKA